MQFKRKHRVAKKANRHGGVATGAQRYRQTAEGIVVQDYDGTEIFRTGSYGDEVGEDTSRGIVVQDSTGNTIGEMNIQDGISFGNPTIGQVVSDNIVTIGRGSKQYFIDYTNGSDSNDGLTPKAYTDIFSNRTGNLDASTASDGLHKWKRLQGTAANTTTTSGTANVKMVVGASDDAHYSAQCGGMFEDIKVNFQFDKNPTVATMNLYVYSHINDKLGFAASGNCARVKIAIAIGGGIPTQQTQIMVDGAVTNLDGPTANPDGISTVGNLNADWSVRLQCYYNWQTKKMTIRSKCWKASGTETTTWTTGTTTTTDNSILQRGGSFGIGANTGAIGNPNITILWSNLTHQLLDPDLLVADDTSGVASDYNYAPTSTGPFQTLGQAVRQISGYNAAEVFINWHNGNDAPIEPNTHIDGIVGPGEIFITSATPAMQIVGGLSFNGCAHFIHLGCLSFTDPGGGLGQDAVATILVNVTRHIEIFDVVIQSNGAGATTTNVTNNILFLQGSEGNVIRSQLDGSVTNCVAAQEGSFVRCNNNAGTGGTNSYKSDGSIIFTIGQAPVGGTAVGTSGKVFATAAADAAGSTGGGTAGSTNTKRTKYFNANGSGSYGMVYGTWASGDVVQGAYGGSQNHKGLWHYPSSVQTFLSPKTIDAIYIQIKRANNGGASSPQIVWVCLFDTSNVNSGNPGNAIRGPYNAGTLAWGQTKWFKLPTPGDASANDFTAIKTAAGTGGGTRAIGVFISGGSPYEILSGVNSFSGAARLKVTYH